ncbi:MAG: PEP-CTERM sorting domain-containing protein [Methylacidiphilales bacterium]|nr:PEP-CTERM sorting domain-containing protein [Candidatus Methylacidiphilales bacterium]
MKKSFILLSLFACVLLPTRANVTVTLDAGQLTGPSGVTTGPNAMQVDNTSPSNNGSLLLLIDLGSSPSATINNTITAGNFVGTGNTILAAGGFNNNSLGGPNETITNFTITSGTSGDYIGLLWFPQITYQQYVNDLATTTAGTYFGSYTPSPLGSTPTDGGSAWTLPSSGFVDFDFITSNNGGNEANNFGYADFQVEAVPEPTAIALFGLGGLLVFALTWRRKSA